MMRALVHFFLVKCNGGCKGKARCFGRWGLRVGGWVSSEWVSDEGGGWESGWVYRGGGGGMAKGVCGSV